MGRRKLDALKALRLLLPLVTLLVSTSARAQEPRPPAWRLDLKASYVVLGSSAARATGGFMPSLTGFRFWPVHELIDVGVGADIGAFGLGGAGHWIGVLGGPASIARFRPPGAPLSFELAARFDFGRIPVCNDWRLCGRYLGFFPAMEVAVAHAWPQHLAIAVLCGVRAVQTLVWSGAAVEPAVAGRLFW